MNYSVSLWRLAAFADYFLRPPISFFLIFLQRSVAIVLIIKWPDNGISEHSVRNVSCSRLTKKRALALKPEEPLFFAIRRHSLRVARRFQ